MSSNCCRGFKSPMTPLDPPVAFGKMMNKRKIASSSNLKSLLIGVFIGFFASNYIFLNVNTAHTCSCTASSAENAARVSEAAEAIATEISVNERVVTTDRGGGYRKQQPIKTRVSEAEDRDYSTASDNFVKEQAAITDHDDETHKHLPFQRLPCRQLFDQVHDGLLFDPNRGIMHKKFTSTDPPFWISLHNEKTDDMRWRSIMGSGLSYERDVTFRLKDILAKEPPQSLVIDAGTNVGWFSLWARALGHRVVGLERHPLNAVRLCESLRLNDWTDRDVKLYSYGVGDKDMDMALPLLLSSPGASSLGIKSIQNTTALVRIETLDEIAEEEGWFANNTNIPLLKIDAEGNDARVISGANRLLKSGLVKNVFMDHSCTLPTGRQQLEIKRVFRRLTREGFLLKQISEWTGKEIKGSQLKVVEGVHDGEELASRLFVFCETRRSPLNLWWSKSK